MYVCLLFRRKRPAEKGEEEHRHAQEGKEQRARRNGYNQGRKDR